MPPPKITYPTTTTFGKRITLLSAEKAAVAKQVVEKFMGSGSSAFIADGSSTFYVGLELFDRAEQATIWTNHLAIAHEYSLWASGGAGLSKMSLDLAGGHVNRDLMMTHGSEAERFVEDASKRAGSIILSVRCLFAHEGPSGVEQESLMIKRAAVRQATQCGAKIIFLADHTKLLCAYQSSIPLVFRLAKDWDDLIRSECTYIVTTKHPKVSGMPNPVPKPTTEEDWYQHHTWPLRQIMKQRFIEV